MASAGDAACKSCDGGKYCDEEGLTNYKGTCEAGYFCKSGAISATPAINLTLAIYSSYIDFYGICPRGYYCPEGSVTPTPCPVGYYLDGEGGQALGDCIKCQAGKYCDVAGLDTPIGLCDPESYCPALSTSKTERTCTSGHYCEEGSPNPVTCPSGSLVVSSAG